MRVLAAIALLAVVALTLHATDVGSRAFALQAFSASPRNDLTAILRYDPVAGKACPRSGTNPDVDALARALITVESLATPYAHAWLKGGLARACGLGGLDPPDLTYGPGRVRLSTARTALAGAAPPDADLALLLLDDCSARDIVARRLVQLLAADGGTSRGLDAERVSRIAAGYNGQGEPGSAEAALAHGVYRRLVFELFQHYRFATLGNPER